jgi:hypothetical protein
VARRSMEKIVSAPFESGSFSDGFHGHCILIVGLNVALKGPYPLVGESEVSRTDHKNFQFI